MMKGVYQSSVVLPVKAFHIKGTKKKKLQNKKRGRVGKKKGDFDVYHRCSPRAGDLGFEKITSLKIFPKQTAESHRGSEGRTDAGT